MSSKTTNLFFMPDKNHRNFGDLAALYLFCKIRGEPVPIPENWNHEVGNRFNENSKYIHPLSTEEDVYFITGSIFITCEKNVIVWGIGMMDRYSYLSKDREPKAIYCVRGPITRQRFLELGMNVPDCLGDPVLLLPRYYMPKIDKKYRLGLIPHYVDYEKAYNMYKDDDKVLIIDILAGIEPVVDDILRCENTLSSSLHGIIVSHAYSIPSYWMKCSNGLVGDGIKFQDYFMSVNVNNKNPYILTEYVAIDKIFEDVCYKQENPSFPIETQHILDSCPFA